jgi:hypothetical protein
MNLIAKTPENPLAGSRFHYFTSTTSIFVPLYNIFSLFFKALTEISSFNDLRGSTKRLKACLNR